ncbi:Na/Pi cotransporter family protein [Vermiculatibacterium agrestimuris]|uniref:Na/Pi cotransporter family protein n=1 Tax=Vermiculatibacterium agrestimuris TaxID=2941519 RepID=UPI00203C0DA7|nr:Na/Pi cotransporter family protein [Vermiculatibacterium agrestimuris]
MTLGGLALFFVRLLAGTGVFLVGVHLLTANIEQLATGKLKELFGKTADKRLVNVGVGAAATALIQSSGVTTVLIVGFVNVGVMNLYQAAAMIMGANIGTTVTAQIAALSAFPITTYIQVLVFVGIMLSMIGKEDTKKKLGLLLAGLGLIFIGLALMSDAMKADRDAIQSLFTMVRDPLLLFFIGIFLTALVQSSSATTSIIIAMSVAGLTVGTGGNEVLYIILGTNIGSCVTALMSSFTAGANARRASFIHLMFNTLGSGIFFLVLAFWPGFMTCTFGRWFSETATQIAMFHTFFNVTCTVLFLPLCGWFVRVSERLIREREVREEPQETYLDERMLASTSLAISQLEKEMVRLSDTAMEAFRTGYRSFQDRDKELIAPTQKLIDRAGGVEQAVVNYLIRLAAQSKLSDERDISRLHGSLADIMRIAEIADNLTKYTRASVDRNLDFSQSVRQELDGMTQRVEELYGLTRRVMVEKDAGLLGEVDRVENDVDTLRKRLIESHIERLNQGACSAASSGVFINLVSNLERLGDHLTYIAHSTVE